MERHLITPVRAELPEQSEGISKPSSIRTYRFYSGRMDCTIPAGTALHKVYGPCTPTVSEHSGCSGGLASFVGQLGGEVSWLVLDLITPLELFDSSSGINKSLFPREERVAFRTDFNPHALLGRTGFYCISATADDFRLFVLRMYSLFHYQSTSLLTTRPISKPTNGPKDEIVSLIRLSQVPVAARVHLSAICHLRPSL